MKSSEHALFRSKLRFAFPGGPVDRNNTLAQMASSDVLRGWMMRIANRRITVLLLVFALAVVWQVASRAQQEEHKPYQLAKSGTRFNFEVIESFDAKYLGDTPGHVGRAGGLEGIRPRVSLGDAVYREDTKIGIVTSALWSRVQGSMTIEFDPLPLTRVSVGDHVWLDLNPSAPREQN